MSSKEGNHRHTWMVEAPRHETEACAYCPARRMSKPRNPRTRAQSVPNAARIAGLSRRTTPAPAGRSLLERLIARLKGR